ncbi:Localization factor PodJL [compost metagenome]
MYGKGEGVALDMDQAATWCCKAAEQGHVNAQYSLGLMYARGEGLAQNFKEAYIWLFVAVANGATDAIELRDQMAEKLSKPQLEIAQALALQHFQKYRSRH